jgi:putative ABC transport system permease protein
MGIVIGVAAVVSLVSLGEGTRKYIYQEFMSLGSNLVGIIPGKVETTGAPPGVGWTTRNLTIEDAEALLRECTLVRRVAPISIGSAAVKLGNLSRTVPIIGSTADFLKIRDLKIASGNPLPEMDPRYPLYLCLIGKTVQRELFKGTNPLGKFVRIGGWRFRVTGVLASKGYHLGMDMDDIVIIPVACGLKLFNQSGLFRIGVQVSAFSELDRAMDQITQCLKRRHGEEDFTLVTQGSIIRSFESILLVLTLTITGIAAISLAVAGIGIMNVMFISVTERRAEIGLCKAVGATTGQIMLIFLLEAILLSIIGGLVGVGAGLFVTGVLSRLVPALPAEPPAWAMISAFGIAIGVGILSGLIPAYRASRVQPVIALQKRV